ncbi:MAG: hypothetical protein KatS3mg028_0077 [Bacteroidia bacterium]|nr:MAG: hypothetical protein KatS3mg028_0077 [Bacteroidia bacterium]
MEQHLYLSKKYFTEIGRTSDSLKENLFAFSLFLLPVGLLFGEVPTSVSEIIVCVLWIFSVKKQEILSLWSNKYFWLLVSLYILHILGLAYTSDFKYALNDLRIKLPLLFFPVVFFSKQEVIHRYFVWWMKWFVVVTFINISYLFIAAYLRHSDIVDARNVSLFISHIRLGLIVAFAIVASFYLIFNHIHHLMEKIFFFVISMIMFVLMNYLGFMTGIVSLFVSAFVGIVYMIVKNANPVHTKRIVALVVFALLMMGVYLVHLHSIYFPKTIKISLYTHTCNGNVYYNDTLSHFSENGYPVFIHICDVELKKEWNKRSQFNYDGKDKNNNELRYTLYRYLASKGLTKDSAGISQLTATDIANIENGCPNYHYCNANFFEKRFYELMQEYYYYQHTKNPSGKTIAMRLFYWKLAFKIWMKNFWTGVGTGDVQNAFNVMYRQYPDIPPHQQLRGHNQILTIAFTFGIIGLMVFLSVYLYPLLTFRNAEDYVLLVLFITIAVLSFFIDDTLETQPGATFIALFYTLLVTRCYMNARQVQ